MVTERRVCVCKVTDDGFNFLGPLKISIPQLLLPIPPIFPVTMPNNRKTTLKKIKGNSEVHPGSRKGE